MKTRKLFWYSLVSLFALILSACGNANAVPTPTPLNADAVAGTAIANFVVAMTQTAFAQPTSTFTPSPSPTNTLAATFAPLGTGSPGVQPTSSCDVLVFITDVNVKDGTLMAPGQVFPKIWRIQNGGTCTWTPTYKVVFTGSGTGGAMGGVTTPIGKAIKPGEYIDITVTFTAPTAPGSYNSWWKIQNDSGVWLGGTPFSVDIQVVGAPVATGTPTETPTATP